MKREGRGNKEKEGRKKGMVRRKVGKGKGQEKRRRRKERKG